MTTIDEISTVDLTGKDEKIVTVIINEHIVQDALHFKEGYEDHN